MVEERKAQPPIIVKARKKAHTGHHGGAWKVAYADFVTAMMAFFLVMWLVNQSSKVKDAVGGYFRDPVAFGEGQGVLEGQAAILESMNPGSNDSLAQALQAMQQEAESAVRKSLAEAGQQIKRQLESAPELATLSANMEIEMTDEGLRIQLIEPNSGEAFFQSGSAMLGGQTTHVLSVIASQLKNLHNHVVIEGHTDSTSYGEGSRYTNWELSADRANSARAAMEEAGMPRGRIREIRGYAANRPRVIDDPSDPRNRRISILVLNDFEETVRQKITLDGQTFVYRDGEGYRNALDALRGQGDPGGATTP
jgi:chemotaxis protein MotB